MEKVKYVSRRHHSAAENHIFLYLRSNICYTGNILPKLTTFWFTFTVFQRSSTSSFTVNYTYKKQPISFSHSVFVYFYTQGIKFGPFQILQDIKFVSLALNYCLEFQTFRKVRPFIWMFLASYRKRKLKTALILNFIHIHTFKVKVNAQKH